MTTRAEADHASVTARQQRQSFQGLLKIDAGNATERELEIHRRALAAKDFDQVIADPVVSAMFQRGVLFFGVCT